MDKKRTLKDDKKIQSFKQLIKGSEFLSTLINDTHMRINSLLSISHIEKWLSDEAIICNIDFNTLDSTNGIKKQLTMIYGIEGKMNNIETFLLFCSIHGFSPRINMVTINGRSLSEYPDLSSLIHFVLKEKDLLFSQDIMNDIKKIDTKTLTNIGPKNIKEILQTIISFSRYNLSEYRKLYGPKNQKLKMTNTFAENIFLEIAMRLEKSVRKKLEIISTYMHLAKYDEDMYFKTDMKFLFRKKSTDHYIAYPIQFTLGQENSHNMKRKEDKIEQFLAKRIEQKKLEKKDFIVLGVNGEFTKYITSPEIKSAYNIRRQDPKKRKSNHKELFPFFMDQLKHKKIVPAQAMYIVLNKIYSEFDFSHKKISEKRNTTTFGKGKSDQRSINNIDIDNIKIFTKYKFLDLSSKVNSIKNYTTKTEKNISNNSIYSPYLFIKWRFSINYSGKHIGWISIYRKF